MAGEWTTQEEANSDGDGGADDSGSGDPVPEFASIHQTTFDRMISSSSSTFAPETAEEEVIVHDSSSRNRSTRTIQITVNEAWIEGLQVFLEEFQDISLDLLESLLHPFFMDAETLMIFSLALLILDRFITLLSTFLDAFVANTLGYAGLSSISTSTGVVLETIESTLIQASWGLYIVDSHPKRKHGMKDGDHQQCNRSDFWLYWVLGCSCDDGMVNGVDVSSLVTPAVIMAGLVAILVNTSYFSTLMAPVYSQLLESHHLSTEVLLGLLLLLFGLETVTALSFFLLGYKLLSVHLLSDANLLLEENGNPNSGYDGAAVYHTYVPAILDEANMMLVLSTILWLVCVVTSKVVRMALYHSIGD